MERVKLQHCTDADRDHKRSPRAYAHVGHYPGTICVANAIVFLPREFVCGILLHELGHLTGAYGEKAADLAGQDLSGVRILRKTHHGHGIARNLEWVSPRDVPKAVRVLKRLTTLDQ